MPAGSELRLKETWLQLWRAALALGVPPDDAEDLVQNALIKALDAFDPARGDLGALAGTTLRNLARNYWRDQKKTGFLPDIGVEDPWASLDDQNVRLLELEEIMKDLDPVERQFLTTLGNLLQEAEGRMVLEAARKCGLTADEGWNIMRKIQRKAQRVRARLSPRHGAAETVFMRPSISRPTGKVPPLEIPPLPSAPPLAHSRSDRERFSGDQYASVSRVREEYRDVKELAGLLSWQERFSRFYKNISPESLRKS